MPREENVDFAGFKASGLDRPTQVIRRQESAPSLGGARGYSVQSRQMMLNNPGNAPASSRSLSRWRNRIEPMKMNGNHSHQKINGNNLHLLIYYRIVFPRASADEIRAFLFNSGSVVLYSRNDIYHAEKILGFVSKKPATTA